MPKNSVANYENLYEYLLSFSLREPEVLQRLRHHTATMPEHKMQISPDQGQFMALLVRLMGAKKTLEMGTYTGYSALSVALALPEEGRVLACDTNTEWTEIAQKFWEEAGVSHKIDLRIELAEKTLNTLIDEGECASFDFAFIDADKTNYALYYEKCLELLRPQGLLIFDNVFQGGDVLDPTEKDENTESIRQLNAQLLHDNRVEISMLPVGDGITLAMKK